MSTQKTVAAVVAAFVLSIVGWNVAWRYDDAVVGVGLFRQRAKVRTHLITGRAEKLTEYGWRPLEATFNGAFAGLDTPPVSPAPSPSGSPTVYDDIVNAPK